MFEKAPARYPKSILQAATNDIKSNITIVVKQHMSCLERFIVSKRIPRDGKFSAATSRKLST